MTVPEDRDRSPKHEHPFDRERVVRNIVDKRTAQGSGVGIFGADVCQLCGHIGAFNGWASAMGSHQGTPREFVCWPCHRGCGEDASFHNSVLHKRLADSPHRYCRICAVQLEPDQWREGERPWACETCRDDVAAQGADLAQFVGDLVRRRWVELRCATDDRLRRLDLSLEQRRLKFDLEEAQGLERLRLDAAGPERAREALRRLGESHGRDYESFEDEGSAS